MTDTLPLPYIVWREIPEPGKKARKVPWSVATGKKIDPHNPSNHMSAAQATATAATAPDLHVGAVLSENDPYFLLDLDACRDPVTGVVTPGVNEIFAMFHGAAAEVSHNMTGFHIYGRCDPAVLGERRNRFRTTTNIDCEFYHTGRFIAVGHGLQGDIETDHTPALAAFVPIREARPDVTLDGTTDPSYTGPEDDEELIRIMLASRGSVSQIFGVKATVSDLWNRDVEVLGRVFPSETGDSFNWSQADASLMSHLAFYTGKNAERMDRLFRRSQLMRDKYLKRPAYQDETIKLAVGGCKKVYDKPRAPKLDDSIGGGGYSEIMTVPEQVNFFAGCFYIAQEHGIMVPGGALLKPQVFNAMYGGHTFLMSGDGSGPTKKAFDAFTENRAHHFPKVSRMRFKPKLPHGTLVAPDGVNCYFPEQIRTVRGDVSPFMDLLALLLPDERDRQILLSWMASLIQNPGVKFLWAPVLQGASGNGKSMVGDILTYCIGDDYSWTVKADKIDAKFNTFLSRRLFINVEEMHMFSKMEMLDTVKDYITGMRQEVEFKGINSIMDRDYCANWFFCTNWRDAVIKTRDDRRFAVLFTAQQTRDDLARDGMLRRGYFPEIYKWLRADGFAAIRQWLMDYQIPAELDPAGDCQIAPDTSSTEEAIAESYSAAEQYILEAVASDIQGFRGGWLSTWAVTRVLRENNVRRSPQKVATLLRGLGYVPDGRAPKGILQEENQRPVLWRTASAGLDYMTAQGYAAPAMSVVTKQGG